MKIVENPMSRLDRQQRRLDLDKTSRTLTERPMHMP